MVGIIRCVEKGEGALAPTDLPSGKSQKAATQLSKSSDVCHQHVAENFVRNSHFFANITSDSSPSRVPHRGHSSCDLKAYEIDQELQTGYTSIFITGFVFETQGSKQSSKQIYGYSPHQIYLKA